jgi:tetratricopeptide (TPR) repeat protein
VSPDEPLRGNLEDTPLAEVLVRLCLDGATGILTLQDDRVVKKICLRQGRVRFVASNIREERLAEQLLEQGRIDQAGYETLTADAKGDLRMGRLAVQLLGMSEVEVADGLRGQIRETLVPCFDWLQGEFRFEEGRPDLGDEIEVSLLPADLALGWARADASDPAHMDSILGGGDRVLKTLPGAFERAEIMALEPVEGFLLSMANGQRTVDELVASCPVAPEVATRCLFVILRAGLLASRADVEEMERTREPAPAPEAAARPAVPPPTPAEAPAPSAEPAPAAPPAAVPEPEQDEREAALAMLQRVGQEDHFAVLGLGRDAEIEEAREAYFSLARRFHPDRHREGELADLHPRLEEAFARITVAYSTLSDPAAREEYLGRDETMVAATPDPSELAAINHRRGLQLYASGRRVEALGFLENAVRLDPGPAAHHRDLGLLQAQNPRLRREAPQALRAALERDPTDVTARVGLALVLRRLGESRESRREMQEAARWEPDHPAVQAASGKAAPSASLRSSLLGPLLVR